MTFARIIKIFRFIITAILFWQTYSLSAQTDFILSGSIYQGDQLVDFAELILLDAKDQSVLKYTTVEDGRFSINKIPPGDYLLRIFALGFLDNERSIGIYKNEELKITLLSDPAFELEEITIVGKKKIFSNQNGNLTVNVASSILSSSSNPLDLLAKLPMVQVSANQESISIIGKGSPLLYLDNQRITLDQYNAISVQDIEDIELIKNPSAKYEAESRAVIVINLKKNKSDGYKVNLTETASAKFAFNNYLGLDASFKKDRLDLKFNAGYNKLQPLEQVVSEFNITNQDVSSSYTATVIGNRHVYLLGGGLSYQLDQDEFISFQINSTIRRAKGEAKTPSLFQQEQMLTNVFTRTQIQDNRDFFNSTFNYNKKWKKNELFIGGQYLGYGLDFESYIENNINNLTFLPFQVRNQDFDIDVYSGRLDIEGALTKQVNYEFGVNSSFSDASTDFRYQDLQNPENLNSSSYRLQENIFAGYTQWSLELNSWDLTSGLRIENAVSEGGFIDDPALLVDRNNTFVFPKASLNFTIDSLQSTTLNYGRSIQRPNFSSLSQTVFYVNPFTVISQNSTLKPTLIDEVSFNYQLRNSSLTVTYTRKNNPVFYSVIYDEENKIYDLTPINFEKETGVQLSLSAPFEHRSWSSSNTLSFISNQITESSGINNDTDPYIYFYTNQELRIPKDWSFSFSGWGMTKRKEGIFQRNALFTVNLALSKKVLKNLNCSLSFNDIFNGINYEESSTLNAIQSTNIFNVDSREIVLTLRYSLGSGLSRYKNRKVYEDEGRVR